MNWYDQLTWWTILDFYFVYVLVLLLLKFILHNKRIFSYVTFYVLMLVMTGIAVLAELPFSKEVFVFIATWYPVFTMIVAAPDIRLTLESLWKESIRKDALVMGGERTKNEIIKACVQLSKEQIGALITIEKHNTLDQYAKQAITLNSEVSSELLINIFTPNTPLHDGAVIVRGDKIICAAAYFVLSSNESFEKTTGSRHRAALVISEITDSLTVVVSEETGSISVAINGVMTKMKDENSLNEYLSLFMK